jgi:o-succinylbenzoate---CoA ligase
MRDFLSAAADASPDAPALMLPYFAHLGAHYARYGYGRLNRIAALLAVRLRMADVRAGDRVALIGDNAQRTIEFLHALWKIGAIVVPINTRWTTEEIAYALNAADVKVVLCDSARESVVRPAAGDRPLYALAPTGRASLPTLREQSDFAGTADELLLTDVHPGAVAAILFTSGTSGRPKGAQLTFGNFAAAADASRARLHSGERDRWLLSLPLYHVGGLAMVVRVACDRSALVLMTPERDTDDIARALVSERVTLASLVPTQLHRLLETDFRAPPSLRMILIGGAAATPELVARAVERGIPIATTYGMTEATSQIATLRPDQVAGKPGCVGRALDGLALRIVDASGADCPPGTIGAIHIAGPTVMRGYLGADPVDGWFDTGDLGYRDSDSDLWLVQRRVDLIISGGENVYPSEVEAALLTHPDVQAACVVGIPDAEWGQRVAALIVARDGAKFDPDALTAYLRTRLAGYKLPRVIRFADAMPLTGSGKVHRAAVADLLLEQTV